MTHRFGKARVPGCCCEARYTCRACLQAKEEERRAQALADAETESTENLEAAAAIFDRATTAGSTNTHTEE